TLEPFHFEATRRCHGILHPAAQGYDPSEDPPRPRRPQGRRTRPLRLHRTYRAHVPAQRPHHLPGRRAFAGGGRPDHGAAPDGPGHSAVAGRTAHRYRRNDPTTSRAEGPLQGVDVQTTGLRPTDQDAPAGEPLLLSSNDDCRISLSRRAETAPFHTRNVDGDE